MTFIMLMTTSAILMPKLLNGEIVERQTYFVSVGPVQNDPYCSNAEIESFNAAMQANLSGVTYIDVYSHLVSEGFSTVDGTHYPDSVSVDIYNYILDHLEEQRSGIWG